MLSVRGLRSPSREILTSRPALKGLQIERVRANGSVFLFPCSVNTRRDANLNVLLTCTAKRS